MASTWSGIERRAHQRWQGEDPQPLPLRIGETQRSGHIRNISAGGIAVEGDFAAQIGTQALVELNDALHLPGVVVRNEARGVAIRFVLSGPLSQQIDQAVRLGLCPAEW
jgi:hypothetical protein